jgi:hypothetical protein
VVKTKNRGFLPEKTDYVVVKRKGVTEGYGQGSDTSKKLTLLKATALLGFSAAQVF